MPPEQLPWDRRDFRKHDRSASDPRFGGGGYGGAGLHRWRDQHHHTHGHPPPPSHPPPYHHHHHHHNNNNHQQPRWYSDFRSSRPIYSGHGKQGGWHMYPDDAGHGFLPFGSRYGDRHLEDDNFQPFASRSDGRYFRTNKESRGHFNQKEWKSSSWEPVAASSGPGKSTTESNSQKLGENTFHNGNSKSIESSHPLLDTISDPAHPLLKEKQQNSGGTAEGLVGSSQKPEKEDGLEAVDWKPLKWSRSGSLPSRGSGFSHMSGTKNIAVDSVEMVAEAEVQQSVVLVPLTGTSNDVSAVLASSEDTNSRKKPRLGWGEGLAKYEKKKVEGPEDGAVKDGLVVNVTTAEIVQSPVNLFDKSPRIASMSDCTSPATPSSVACSSSPGNEEKDSTRLWNATQDNTNLSRSPCITSQMHYDGPAFNLENLDVTSIAKLSSFINEMLQSEDLRSVETDFVKTTSMNKLLVWKAGILKALEVTESTIDSLETELKSLVAEPRVCCPSLVSSLLPRDYPLKPCEDQAVDYALTVEPAPLEGISSGNIDVGNVPTVMGIGTGALKGGVVTSPGSAAFRMSGVLTSAKDECPSGSAELDGMVKDLNNSCNLNKTFFENGFGSEVDSFHDDFCQPTPDRCQNANSGNIHSDVNHIYDSILAANKESASSALKELNKLLPSRQSSFDISMSTSFSPFQRDLLGIKEKFRMRRRSLKFKEKVVTLKYRVFQHFCKEGCVVCVRKLKGKSQKISDFSLSGHKKNRSSNRSRISYLAWNHRTVSAEEVIKCINELLIESPCKPCRSSLNMPALILDKQTKNSRFISNNGLVEDPCAVEKERSTVNSWTAEETEIFIDNLAIFGKNFRKIASFLDHRTIADCIEFYYKNHKSESFSRARKKPEFAKQRKSQTTTYLVGTGKRWNREVNAASLDILDEASAVASNVNDGIATQLKCSSSIFFGSSSSNKASRGIDGTLQRSNNLEFYSSETAAADVLAGICGSRSSEAMNSCITSSFDHADGYRDWKYARVGCGSKQASTPDHPQNGDDECSDDSCGEMDSIDWTDEEKSTFVRAVSSYGKDFAMISQLVRTKSEEQCRIFFIKTRKCLGLYQIHRGASNNIPGDDTYGGGSDNEDGCVVQTGSIISQKDSGCKIKEDVPLHEMVSHESADVATHALKPEVQICEENSGSCPMDYSVAADSDLGNSPVGDAQAGNTAVADCNVAGEGQNGTCESEFEAGILITSSHVEPGQAEEGCSCGIANGKEEPDKDALPDTSGSCMEESEGTGGLMLPDGNLDTKKVTDRGANSIEFTKVSHAQSELLSVQELRENALHASNYAQSSMQDASRYQKEAEDKTQLGKNALANGGARETGEKSSLETDMTRDSKAHLPGCSLLDATHSTQVFRGYPISGQYVKEIKEDTNCNRHALQQNPELRGNLHSDHHTDFSMQKCTRPKNEVLQAPLPSQDKNSKDNSRSPSGSADSEMPPRNGDVKLFGKILISSQQNPNTCAQGTCGDNNDKAASCQLPNDHSAPFPQLSDPSLLSAKYPAAGNPSASMVKLEPPPLHGVVRSNTGPLNGVTILPGRELSSSNEVVDSQVIRNREVQPLQVQDVLPSEMQSRDRFNAVHGMQTQQGTIGMLGINDVGGRVGVVVGGQPVSADGVSDHATAIKMQFDTAQNTRGNPHKDNRNYNGDVGSR